MEVESNWTEKRQIEFMTQFYEEPSQNQHPMPKNEYLNPYGKPHIIISCSLPCHLSIT